MRMHILPHHTTPHQIPQDDREQANERPCREMVPDSTGVRKAMLVRRASIDGNCRVHDIEMMLDILLKERRPPDTRSDD